MRYISVVLLLAGFTGNLFADDAQPVEIPGYTPPNFSTKPPTPPKSQSNMPSTATAPAATNAQQSNTQQQNAQAMIIKQATALRQCQPQVIDLTNMLASNQAFTKKFGNTSFQMTVLGTSQGNCHIISTMAMQGLVVNGKPVTVSADCLVTPSTIEDMITSTQLMLRDKQAGQPPQPDTQQLLLKFMQEYFQSCNMTFNGKSMALPPEMFNPANLPGIQVQPPTMTQPLQATQQQPMQQPAAQTPTAQQPAVQAPALKQQAPQPTVQTPSVQPQMQQPAVQAPVTQLPTIQQPVPQQQPTQQQPSDPANPVQ